MKIPQKLSKKVAEAKAKYDAFLKEWLPYLKEMAPQVVAIEAAFADVAAELKALPEVAETLKLEGFTRNKDSAPERVLDPAKLDEDVMALAGVLVPQPPIVSLEALKAHVALGSLKADKLEAAMVTQASTRSPGVTTPPMLPHKALKAMLGPS